MADKRIDVVKAAMAAWARHDIDELLTFVSDDIEWHYQVGSRPVIGATSMAKVLNRLKEHQRDSRWRLVRFAEADNTIFIEGVDDYQNPKGHRVRVPYMGVYEFDGMTITAWRDYVDLGLMARGESGEELPEWLVPLVEAGQSFETRDEAERN